MENYIMLNGKKIELTPEQVKLILADEFKKSKFDRVGKGGKYFYVEADFKVCVETDDEDWVDDARFYAANYCADEEIMKQHALHMELNNLLWRYSMTHGGDEITFDAWSAHKYNIFYNKPKKTFFVTFHTEAKNLGTVYFSDEETARSAIEEVVIPFIEAHPEFDIAKM